MAITLPLETSQGVTLAEAYVRLDTIYVTPAQVQTGALVYASAEARASGKPHFELVQLVFVPDVTDDAPQIFTQAYAALKAMGRFAEAEDA